MCAASGWGGGYARLTFAIVADARPDAGVAVVVVAEDVVAIAAADARVLPLVVVVVPVPCVRRARRILYVCRARHMSYSDVTPQH